MMKVLNGFVDIFREKIGSIYAQLFYSYFSYPHHGGVLAANLSGGALLLWCPPPLLSAPSPRREVRAHPGRAGGVRWKL